GVWIGVASVVVIAIAFFVYVSRKPGSATSPVSTASMGSAATNGAVPGADAGKDLRVVSVTMQKDYTGTTAQWLVDIKNDSRTYTYSNIGYETTYIGAAGNVLLVNHGKINLSLGPGEDQNTQFRDALYPDGTSIYRIKLTGASASQ
ncbi:MAG: hypothetical protein KGL02_12080, partial [Acidobacteriota bacterium]|nr:hypothetical protein [Acidobacteriota bacterium]